MVVTMRVKENHTMMEDKWEPMMMGPTIAGSMLETCKGRAVGRWAPGRWRGPICVSPLPQGGTSKTSLTQVWRI